jgi:hypothetical protein
LYLNEGGNADILSHSSDEKRRRIEQLEKNIAELKEKMKVKSDKEMFEKFIHVLKQNGCPTFANSGTSRYTVLSYTPSAKAEFIKLMSEGVDVERLAACTIKYYKKLTHPKTILNYFRDGDWKIWYEDEEASGLLPNRQDINL